MTERKTKQLGTPDGVFPLLLSFPVAATTTIGGGQMVATDASGNAVEASADSALKLWGRCEKKADNSTGLAGDINVEVRAGAFWFANGGDITAAHVGLACYASAGDTVYRSASGGTRPFAGIILAVDSTLGVAVGVGVPFGQPAYEESSELATTTAFRARGTGPSSNVTLSDFAVASNDGITYAAGDVVLLYAQTSAPANGPYVVGTVSGGSAALTRPDWWPTGATIKTGTVVRVGGEGTLFKNTDWKVCAAADGITVGTTSAAIFPGRVIQQTSLASGASSITNVPVLSITKTAVVLSYVSDGHASTTMYQTSSFVASTTGAGTIAIAAKSAPATTNTSDSATLNVAVVNW